MKLHGHVQFPQCLSLDASQMVQFSICRNNDKKTSPEPGSPRSMGCRESLSLGMERRKERRQHKGAEKSQYTGTQRQQKHQRYGNDHFSRLSTVCVGQRRSQTLCVVQRSKARGSEHDSLRSQHPKV